MKRWQEPRTVSNLRQPPVVAAELPTTGATFSDRDDVNVSPANRPIIVGHRHALIVNVAAIVGIDMAEPAEFGLVAGSIETTDRAIPPVDRRKL